MGGGGGGAHAGYRVNWKLKMCLDFTNVIRQLKIFTPIRINVFPVWLKIKYRLIFAGLELVLSNTEKCNSSFRLQNQVDFY